MKSKTLLQKGVLALVLLAIVFAFMNVMSRYLGTGFELFQQVYLRVFVALAIAVVVFWPQLRWQVIAKLPLREWLVLAFRGLAIYAIGVVLIAQASITTSIGNVSFISALPILALLGFFFLKEKVTWWKLAFIGGSLVGVSLLATTDLSGLLHWGMGDVLAIVANVAFALGYISRKWHSDTLNNQEISTLTFVFGASFCLLLSIIFGEGMPSFDGSWFLWVVILAGGAFNVINMFLVNYGFQHVDAVRAGNLLTLEVAFGVLFGFLFYQEVPTLQGLIGGLLIVGCVLGMNTFSRRDIAKNAAETAQPIA